MSVWWSIPFFLVIIVVGVSINNYKANQCEHNGLGKWHYWTQVCEPIKP